MPSPIDQVIDTLLKHQSSDTFRGTCNTCSLTADSVKLSSAHERTLLQAASILHAKDPKLSLALKTLVQRRG